MHSFDKPTKLSMTDVDSEIFSFFFHRQLNSLWTLAIESHPELQAAYFTPDNDDNDFDEGVDTASVNLKIYLKAQEMATSQWIEMDNATKNEWRARHCESQNLCVAMQSDDATGKEENVETSNKSEEEKPKFDD